MGINRISSSSLTDQSINFLNGNLSLLSNLQEKLASGRNINQPSDDPVGLTRILNLSNTLSTDERFNRNIENALAEVSVADSVMSNITELIHRAKDLGVQGATFTADQTGRNALALEIDEIVNQMVQLGNTSIGGKFIFGGKATGTPPFTRAGTDVNYSGNPPATAWERPTEISISVEVNANTNGELLLGQAQVVAPGPPPVFSGISNGVFQTLISLRENLLQGNLPAVRNRLDDLDVDLNNVLAQQSRVGSVTNRLELTQSRIEERKSVFTQQFADIQNIDMPTLIADLNFQESVFQGSLATTARVLQASLLQFLR